MSRSSKEYLALVAELFGLGLVSGTGAFSAAYGWYAAYGWCKLLEYRSKRKFEKALKKNIEDMAEIFREEFSDDEKEEP